MAVLSVLAPMFSPAVVSAQGGFPSFTGDLVQCGRSGQVYRCTDPSGSGEVRYVVGDECSVCDFVVLGQRIINFMIFLGVVAATLLFVYAGLLYMTAQGNAGQVSSAHGIFKNVLIGLIVILAAWLMVDVIMKTFYAGQFGPWNQIICAGVPTHAQDDGASCVPYEPEENTPIADDDDQQTVTRQCFTQGVVGAQTRCFDTVAECNAARNSEMEGLPAAIQENFTPCTAVEIPIEDNGPQGCTGCASALGLQHASGQCQYTNGDCQVSQAYAEHLPEFINGLGPEAGNIAITSAFDERTPAQGGHSNPCHAAGNCIDIDFTNRNPGATPTVEDVEAINNVIAAAIAAGYVPRWEVPDASWIARYQAVGVETQYMEHVPGVATHFSIYCGNNGSPDPTCSHM